MIRRPPRSTLFPTRRSSDLHDLLPASSAFLALQQHGIQKGRVVAVARLEGRQVENPRHPVELEPQTVGKKHQGPTRNLLWSRPGNKPQQCLAKSIPIRRQLHSRSLGEQLWKGEALHQYAMQKGRRRPMRRPPPLSRAHSPGVMALHALAAPLTKPSNRSATTGGFRMFGVHACELPQPPACCPTRKRPSPCQTSTEFLYPSPICDLKPGRTAISPPCLHGARRRHAVQRSTKRQGGARQH